MNDHRCPYCHNPLEVVIYKASPALPQAVGNWRRLGSMQHAAPNSMMQAALAGLESEWQKVTPVGKLEPRDILTAGLDAAVSFGLVTVAVGGICLYFDYVLWLAPAAGLAVSVWRYFDGMSLARGLLETVETLTNRDLDKDGQVGPQRAAPHVVRVELTERRSGGVHQAYMDFGVEPLKLQRLAVDVLAGNSFSERTAAGCGLTQEEFGNLRDQFIERGLARWNHPNRRQQGVSITRGGKAALQAIVDTPIPPAGDTPYRENSVQAARSSTQHGSQHDFGADGGWDYE